MSPNQAFDLDALKLRINPPEKSKDLQVCKAKGWIKVLKSDRKEKRKKKAKETPKIDGKLLVEIQKMLRSEIQSHFKDTNKADPRLNQMMSMMMQLLQQGKTLSPETIQEAKTAVGDEDMDIIDEETLSRIHAQAVDRMAKNTEGEVQYKEESVDSSEINQHASELQDLIG
jgi:hypothetical protein